MCRLADQKRNMLNTTFDMSMSPCPPQANEHVAQLAKILYNRWVLDPSCYIVIVLEAWIRNHGSRFGLPSKVHCSLLCFNVLLSCESFLIFVWAFFGCTLRFHMGMGCTSVHCVLTLCTWLCVRAWRGLDAILKSQRFHCILDRINFNLWLSLEACSNVYGGFRDLHTPSGQMARRIVDDTFAKTYNVGLGCVWPLSDLHCRDRFVLWLLFTAGHSQAFCLKHDFSTSCISW